MVIRTAINNKEMNYNIISDSILTRQQSSSVLHIVWLVPPVHRLRLPVTLYVVVEQTAVPESGQSLRLVSIRLPVHRHKHHERLALLRHLQQLLRVRRIQLRETEQVWRYHWVDVVFKSVFTLRFEKDKYVMVLFLNIVCTYTYISVQICCVCLTLATVRANLLLSSHCIAMKFNNTMDSGA